MLPSIAFENLDLADVNEAFAIAQDKIDVCEKNKKVLNRNKNDHPQKVVTTATLM